jgi:hypothetical protein
MDDGRGFQGDGSPLAWREKEISSSRKVLMRGSGGDSKLVDYL